MQTWVRQYVPGRAQEWIASLVMQTTNQAHLCVLEEMGQSESSPGTAFRALQLLPGPRIAEDHASDGSRDHGPRLDY